MNLRCPLCREELTSTGDFCGEPVFAQACSCKLAEPRNIVFRGHHLTIVRDRAYWETIFNNSPAWWLAVNNPGKMEWKGGIWQCVDMDDSV